MDKLIMDINNYKSINHANIEINKLNVVSGVNGSGKSTLSRILYSFLKGNSTNRKDFFLERIIWELNQIMDHLDDEDIENSGSSEDWDAILDSYENYMNQYIKVLKKKRSI